MIRTVTACLVMLACLPAATCAGGSRPAVEIRTVEKLVEVQKPCPVEAPARPAAIGALPSGLVELAAALGAKLKEYAAPGGYADRAEAAIRICRSGGR